MTELLRGAVGLNQRNIHLLVWSLGSVLVALAGPFGTYGSMSFTQRLLFWGLVIVSSSFVSAGLRRLAARLVPDDRPWRRDGLVVGLMSVVFTPVVWTVDWAIAHEPGSAPLSFLRLMFFVACITIGVCAMRRVIRTHFVARPESAAPILEAASADAAPAAEPPRLIRRLPGSFDGRIIRLNVNDHRVMVVTTEGEYAIRLRFGDAVEEMDTVDGFCTHRSHWVARQAVQGAEKERGKTYLRLVNGDRVPVSRTYMPELEDAGLI